MKPTYRQSTKDFSFYNRNPKNKLLASDCVARAISIATGLSWCQVIREITELGITLGSVFNDKKVYEAWLHKKGWVKMKQPRKLNNTKYTLTEFMKKQPKGRFLVKLAHHLTFVEDGKVYDTWNCTKKTVGNYWVQR